MLCRAVLLLALGLAGCHRAPPGGALHTPRRIVSLTPSLTEIAFALQTGEQVVGVSDFCDYPEAVKTRPRVGTFLQPNIEKILSLQPDLVLLDDVQKDVAEMLTQAGVRALPLPMQSLADVRQAIRLLGATLDRRAEAQALLDTMNQEVARVQTQSSVGARRRVLFIVDREIGGLRGLVAAGPGSYLDELIQLAGGQNIFADLPMRYAKIAAEELIVRQPETILDAVHVSDRSASTLVARDWQALPELKAVQRKQVFLLEERGFVTPGPRLGRVLHELAQLLHPESVARVTATP